jgi:hypothetical protein
MITDYGHPERLACALPKSILVAAFLTDFIAALGEYICLPNHPCGCECSPTRCSARVLHNSSLCSFEKTVRFSHNLGHGFHASAGYERDIFNGSEDDFFGTIRNLVGMVDYSLMEYQ